VDLIYIFIGLFVNLIFLFRIDWLIRKESYQIILGLSIVLFIAGLSLHYMIGDQRSASRALLIPLVSALIFQLLRKMFVTRLKREPQDTAYNWRSGLLWDRLFAILYWMLSMGFAILVLAP
jgi:uncharacterized membrane protein